MKLFDFVNAIMALGNPMFSFRDTIKTIIALQPDEGCGNDLAVQFVFDQDGCLCGVVCAAVSLQQLVQAHRF